MLNVPRREQFTREPKASARADDEGVARLSGSGHVLSSQMVIKALSAQKSWPIKLGIYA